MPECPMTGDIASSKYQLRAWYNIRGISWRSSSSLFVSRIVPYAPEDVGYVVRQDGVSPFWGPVIGYS